MIRFPLRTSDIELYKLLKACGLTENGGQAKHLVREGRVRVDGQVEILKGKKITAGQIVEVDGEEPIQVEKIQG